MVTRGSPDCVRYAFLERPSFLCASYLLSVIAFDCRPVSPSDFWMESAYSQLGSIENRRMLRHSTKEPSIALPYNDRLSLAETTMSVVAGQIDYGDGTHTI